MKKFFIILLIILYNNFLTVYANGSNKHQHSESSYQHVWCQANDGIEEYKNPDKTRIDCLTQTHAVEFDFGNKWAESIGQALHYSYMTGKKGKVVLILENPKNEMVYYNRVKHLGEKYDFDTEYITTDYLNIKKGKCQNKKCKCYKNKNKRFFMLKSMYEI